MTSRLGRRTFLRRGGGSLLALAGGSSVLAYWLRSAVGRAQGEEAPKRLLVMLRPNGSITEDWLSNGQRGSILEPFAGVWQHAVALKGANVRPSDGSTGGSHEAGLLTIMTGARLGPTYRTNDDYRSTARSLDQILIDRSPALAGRPVQSLQLGAHGMQDGGNETPNITMSYSGPDTPIYPVLNPDEVYTRVFGDLLPGGGTDANLDELARRRARRASVLDFLTNDLARVRAQFPTSMREDLDVHAEAIREMERGLDAAPGGGSGCEPPTYELGLDGRDGDYQQVARVGDAQLRILTAAFACDLTRIATFMWATGASRVSFGPLGTNNHHSTSHTSSRSVLSAVDRWYSERTAAFIQHLADTTDVGGRKLIDQTLVWYLSEVSEGWNHSFDDYPFLFFGGEGVRLAPRGRVLDVSGRGHTANDVWTTLAPLFGTTLSSFETDAAGPIGGLLTS